MDRIVGTWQQQIIQKMDRNVRFDPATRNLLLSEAFYWQAIVALAAVENVNEATPVLIVLPSAIPESRAYFGGGNYAIPAGTPGHALPPGIA